MKFRVRCEGRTGVVEIENNALTTVNDLKTTILTSALSHLSSDIHLSLNQRTPLEEDSTLSDAGLVHGDTIYVMIPPGVTCNISLSSSSTSQKMDEAGSCSMSSSSAEVRVGANSEQVAESHNDLGQASSETMMACGDADVVQDDVTMQTDEGLDVEINRYLNEPMLIREATESSLPQSLVKLYDEVNAPGSFRALAVLLKVLMNELGYLEEDKAATVTAIHNWTCPKILQMNFVYPVLDATRFSLLLVPMHETLIVHGRAELFNSETLSIKLQVAVVEFIKVATISDDPRATFQGEKLPALSRTFKDTIAYPLLQFGLAGSGLCAKPSLSTLALELQMEIMKRLDVPSLLRLSEVCHQLHDACQDRSIWRHKFIKDFGASQISAKDLTENWKGMYNNRYKTNKAMKKQMNFWRPETTFPPILPIGGEYDLNPFFPAPRAPICMGGPVMFPFSNGSSLEPSFDEYMLPSVHPAFRYGHPGGARGGPFCFRF